MRCVWGTASSEDAENAKQILQGFQLCMYMCVCVVYLSMLKPVPVLNNAPNKSLVSSVGAVFVFPQTAQTQITYLHLSRGTQVQVPTPSKSLISRNVQSKYLSLRT